jgi:hypothetical protein
MKSVHAQRSAGKAGSISCLRIKPQLPERGGYFQNQHSYSTGNREEPLKGRDPAAHFVMEIRRIKSINFSDSASDGCL